MGIIRKITLKAIGCDPAIAARENRSVNLAIFRGVAKVAQYKETDYGMSIALKGEFAATNLETGEEFEANTMYVPKFVEATFEAALMGEQKTEVEFAFIVTANPAKRKDGTMGYEYGVKSVVDPAKSDAMKRLDAATAEYLKQEAPALPAPKAEETAENKGGKKK